MVGLQTLDLAIGVRVPASQPNRIKHLRAAQKLSRPFCVPIVCQPKFLTYCVPVLVNSLWSILRDKAEPSTSIDRPLSSQGKSLRRVRKQIKQRGPRSKEIKGRYRPHRLSSAPPAERFCSAPQCLRI